MKIATHLLVRAALPLLAFSLVCTSIQAEESDEGPLHKTGRTFEKVATNTGTTIEHGARATGRTLKHGAEATGRTVMKGAHNTGQTLKKLAS
jgi:hypothetical protein